jgi:hypothetical protein
MAAVVIINQQAQVPQRAPKTFTLHICNAAALSRKLPLKNIGKI